MHRLWWYSLHLWCEVYVHFATCPALSFIPQSLAKLAGFWKKWISAKNFEFLFSFLTWKISQRHNRAALRAAVAYRAALAAPLLAVAWPVTSCGSSYFAASPSPKGSSWGYFPENTPVPLCHWNSSLSSPLCPTPPPVPFSHPLCFLELGKQHNLMKEACFRLIFFPTFFIVIHWYIYTVFIKTGQIYFSFALNCLCPLKNALYLHYWVFSYLPDNDGVLCANKYIKSLFCCMLCSICKMRVVRRWDRQTDTE